MPANVSVPGEAAALSALLAGSVVTVVVDAGGATIDCDAGVTSTGIGITGSSVLGAGCARALRSNKIHPTTTRTVVRICSSLSVEDATRPMFPTRIPAVNCAVRQMNSVERSRDL